MRPAPILLAALLAGCAAPAATRAPTPPTGETAAPPAATTPPPAPAGPAAAAEARGVLLRFSRAAQGGRWQEAWPLLTARWRTATSPGRLGADFRGAGPVAREAADRVVLLLEAGAALEGDGDRLALPVGPGRSARLVREAGGWRVDALE